MSVSLAPQWDKIAVRMAAAKKELEALQKDPDKPDWWNRAYPAKVTLPLSTGTVAFGQFTVDPGTTFFAKTIQAVYEVSGVLAEDSVTNATLVIPESMRPQVFDYTWRVRDSGTDRDWSNLPVPSSVLRGGNVNPMVFLNGQARIRGGARVQFTVNPTFFDSTSTSTGVQTVSNHSLTFVLTGVAVRDGVL